MSRQKGGSIYRMPGCKTWTIQYYRNHKCVKESTGEANYRVARQLLNRRLHEIGTGTYAGPKMERIQVEELAELLLRDYRINQRKSLDDVKERWELHLKPFFGELRAMDVSSTLIDQYVDERQQEDAANATINREMAALKRMFRLGHNATPPLVLHLPRFPKLEENNIRTGFLEGGQAERIVAYCPELWFRGLVECGRTYGWRKGELLNMRVSQADLAQRVIRLEPGTTKNRDGRTAAMTDAVWALLGALVEGKGPNDYVFTRGGKPIKDFRVTWQKACEHAGVPGLLFHDLRRTAARDLRREGIDESVIMKIGGWKTPSVFKRYAIVDQRDLRDAMAKLEQARKREAMERLEREQIANGANDHDNDHDFSQNGAERSGGKNGRVN
ncbi:MAG TPA: site-specific integrase [Terriglobales bacterium]